MVGLEANPDKFIVHHCHAPLNFHGPDRLWDRWWGLDPGQRYSAAALLDANLERE